MRSGRHGRLLIRDYPWALRVRLRSAREREVPPAWAHGDRVPVVLLPGVYETWHFLRAVGDRLSAAGHPVVTVPGLGYNSRPVADSAETVWTELVRHDLRDVVLVAHSKGGLIGKHLLAIDDTEQRIERLVAIATPFGGTSLARLAFNRTLRDFRLDDPLIRSLTEQREVDARITSIFPTFDPHIPEGSRLEGATNVEIRMSGHFGILLDERTLDAVEQAVAGTA